MTHSLFENKDKVRNSEHPLKSTRWYTYHRTDVWNISKLKYILVYIPAAKCAEYEYYQQSWCQLTWCIPACKQVIYAALINLPTILTPIEWRIYMYGPLYRIIIGSSNGVSSFRRQTAIRFGNGILKIGHLGTNFNEIWLQILHLINTLMPRQNGSHFSEDILKCISLN